MYFRRQVTSNILVVKDFYANLLSMNDAGVREFDFSYSIPIIEAFAQKALRVDVSVYSKIVPHKSVTVGATSNDGIIDASRTQMADAKAAKLEQEKYLLYRTSSDVTAAVDNTLIKGIQTGNLPDAAFRKPVLRVRSVEEIKVDADDAIVTIMQKPTVDAGTPTKRLQESMLAAGRDPSSITELAHASVPPYDLSRGTTPKQRVVVEEHDPRSQLLARQLSGGIDASSSVVERASVRDDRATLKVFVAFNVNVAQKKSIKQSIFYVVFELVNASGEIVQTIEKTLDVSSHEQLFNTPRKPPVVSMSSSSSTFTVFGIKSRDSRTTSINVYKKSIGRSDTVVQDYQFVENLRLDQSYKGETQHRVSKPYIGTTIYRFVPVGISENEGFEFTNIVLVPSRVRQKNAIAISLQPMTTGIQVTVTGFASNVVAVQIVARNVTLREKSFKNVGTPSLVDAPDAPLSVQYVDTNVADDRTYEYATLLRYRNGTSEVTGGSIIYYVQPQPGKVTTLVNDVVVNKSQSPNVSFSIDTTLISTNLDNVKELLENARVIDYFKNDVQKERELLSSLLAHNVQRVNITTGAREDFGVLTGRVFDDAALREKNSALSLQLGHNYRYEINTLLRSPETLFQELVKEKIDVQTKKRYKFNPSKFFHPMTLKKGVLVTARGLAAVYAKDQMMYGNIGVTQTLDVSLDKLPTSPQGLMVARFDRDLNVLSWTVSGNVASVDHFLVMKQMNGVRTLIGKTHSEFFHGSCKFYHDLTQRDIGELTYVVTAVFNDYSLGLPVYSTPVIVEEI